MVPKIDEKSMSTSESDFSTDVGFALVKPILFRFLGIKNPSKIDKKSIKKRVQDGHQKREVKNLIFFSIWWFLGGKLGFKIHQKSMRKVI